MIEILEHRIAPAALIGAGKLIYTDTDGDLVTVTFSKNVFTGDAAAQLAKANEVFKFDMGDVGTDSTTPQQLQLIDFTKFPVIASKGSTVDGVGLTIIAEQVGMANGFANVGAISGVGVSLGKIVIDGDLGQVDAGGAALKIGLAGLTVQSIGQLGTSTQIQVAEPTATNPAPDLVSTITGELSFLKVIADVKDARVRVIDGKNSQGQVTTAAKLGSLAIGGSLVGRTAVEAASDDTGEITSERGIGAIVIGGSVMGGGGANSGRISAAAGIASVDISGGLAGADGTNSGTIMSRGNVGAVKIGGDVAGGIGENSGTLRAFGNISSLTVGEDIVAGVGPRSGFVSAIGSIAKVRLTGDIDGTTPNAGARSGGIFADGLPDVKVLGNIFGGSFAQTGSIESGRDIGKIEIIGSVEGGVGDGSGSILAQGAVKSVLIRGDLTGSDGQQSGLVRSGLDPLQAGGFGSITVLGHVEGGMGGNSGAVISGGSLGSVTIGGSATTALDALAGGGGLFSGAVSALGKIGKVEITGNVQGGDGNRGGTVSAFDRIDETGEFVGDLGNISISGHLGAGAGIGSGAITADGGIAKLTLGALSGGTIRTGDGLLSDGDAGTLRILGDASIGSTILIGGKLKTFTVGGNANGTTLRVADTANALTFTHDLTDSELTVGIKLARLTVRGNASATNILAGYDLTGTPSNPDAQIGSIKVNGNWTASSIVAGVAVGADAGFGNALDEIAPGFDDPGIVSKIASITIRGTVTGAPGESTGIVAQLIRSVTIGPTRYALNNLADAQILPIGPAENSVTIRELDLSPSSAT